MNKNFCRSNGKCLRCGKSLCLGKSLLWDGSRLSCTRCDVRYEYKLGELYRIVYVRRDHWCDRLVDLPEGVLLVLGGDRL